MTACAVFDGRVGRTFEGRPGFDARALFIQILKHRGTSASRRSLQQPRQGRRPGDGSGLVLPRTGDERVCHDMVSLRGDVVGRRPDSARRARVVLDASWIWASTFMRRETGRPRAASRPRPTPWRILVTHRRSISWISYWQTKSERQFGVECTGCVHGARCRVPFEVGWQASPCNGQHQGGGPS